MREFDKYFKDEFFIIDSDNLNSVKRRLYGYAIQDRDFVIDSDVTDDTVLSDMGAYIFVKADDEYITISQDFNGSYGIYIYQNGDYFALSNSFIKLVEYLKFSHDITLNRDYADAYLFTGICSYAYSQTLVNEITVIPRNYIIKIKKTDKSIEYNEIDYEEHSISIDSPEGVASLDRWFFKWVETIRSIRKQTNNISFDLTGGFDSRIVSALWLNANIDFDSLRIYCNNSASQNPQDFEIASQIANHFNFKLNRQLKNERTYFEDLSTIIDASFAIKFGFHKQLYFRYQRANVPVYAFTGHGGGCIRGHPNQTREEYTDDLIHMVSKIDTALVEPSMRIIESSMNDLKEKFNVSDVDGYELPEIMYKEGRNRNHFGKGNVESYMGNRYTFSPIIDSDLHKIKVTTDECKDSKLLIALIFTRFCPDLLNFDFNDDKIIDESTLEYARYINEKYPFKPKEYEFIPALEDDEVTEIDYEPKISYGAPKEYFKDLFYSDAFRFEFEKYYPNKYYKRLKRVVERRKSHPLGDFFAALSILRVIEAVNISKNRHYTSSKDWLDSFPENAAHEKPQPKIPKLLKKYTTARVDIKNMGGEENSIEIIENSDYLASVLRPKWFTNEHGIGTQVRSERLSMDLKFVCHGDGELNVRLRAVDVKDKSANRFPVYIDYRKFAVNGEDILDEPKLVTLEDFYLYKKDVSDGEEVNITLEWLPFNDQSVYVVEEEPPEEEEKPKSRFKRFF